MRNDFTRQGEGAGPDAPYFIILFRRFYLSRGKRWRLMDLLAYLPMYLVNPLSRIATPYLIIILLSNARLFYSVKARQLVKGRELVLNGLTRQSAHV